MIVVTEAVAEYLRLVAKYHMADDEEVVHAGFARDTAWETLSKE